MAVDIQLRDVEGGELGSLALAEDIFGVVPNIPVLHQVVTAQLAAARRGTQSTKTRAEVSGGGKKPFKQKGTGRARQGSERAPHFIGGGIAFGPKPRSYKQRTPKKMVALALRSALSDRAAEGKIVVVDSWPFSPPSTKAAIQALSALGLEGKVLVVLSREDEDARRSFRNLPDVQLIKNSELNAYDILINDWIVFTSETVPGETVLTAASPAAAPAAKAKRATKAKAKPAEDVEDVATPEDVTPEDVAIPEDVATPEVADDEEGDGE